MMLDEPPALFLHTAEVLPSWQTTHIGVISHERSATSTSKTCRKGMISCEKMTCFLGKGMLPKSNTWQCYLAKCFHKP